MDDFVKLNPEERRIFFEGTSTPRNMQAQIVEKDFWVCWTLKELFRLPTIGEHLIFKGGTSLSKVFQIIERFSEDIENSSCGASGRAQESILQIVVGEVWRGNEGHAAS